MLETCPRCNKDFLTEADPYIVIPTAKGKVLHCTCILDELRKENQELKEYKFMYESVSK